MKKDHKKMYVKKTDDKITSIYYFYLELKYTEKS